VDLPQRLAFVVQPNRLQGLIWQALLKSQKFSVILENANADLSDCLAQIDAAGLTLPDLIILDAETPGLNPYEFCRWCREQFPKIQIFLTRVHSQPLSDTECRWATKQGAVAFFNGFDRETLMTTAVASIKQILAAADEPFLDERALLTVLLNIRRQIGSTKSSGAAGESSAAAMDRVNTGDVASKVGKDKAGHTGDVLNDLDWVASGLRALNQTAAKAEGRETVPTNKVSSIAEKAVTNAGQSHGAEPQSVPTRRYRGVAY
jgi:CheY-like chemotaxis protein